MDWRWSEKMIETPSDAISFAYRSAPWRQKWKAILTIRLSILNNKELTSAS